MARSPSSTDVARLSQPTRFRRDLALLLVGVLAGLLLSPLTRRRSEAETSLKPTDRASAAAKTTVGLSGRSPLETREFEQFVQPFLRAYCSECHAADSAEANFQTANLAGDFASQPTFNDVQFAAWLKVYEMLTTGAMPPEDTPPPPPRQLAQVARWIAANLEAAGLARQRREGRVVMRRLNRVEYENTVHDLLDIDIDLKSYLPEDNAAGGFDNVGEALQVSSVLMERYLEAADIALDTAIVHGPRPKTLKSRYSYKDEPRVAANKNLFLPVEDGVVFFGSRGSPSALSRFRAPADGNYRFRISAYAYQTESPVVLRAYGGNVIVRSGKTHLMGYWDVGTKPTIVEFTAKLQKADSIKVVPYGTGATSDGKIIYLFTDASEYPGPGMVVQWVEVEGPIHETWPPRSHTRLVGGLSSAIVNAEAIRRNRRTRPIYDFETEQPLLDGVEILRNFAQRAFRRPVSSDELQPYIELVKARLEQGAGFDAAIRVGLKAVLCAPDFLYLVEEPTQGSELSGYELASRLSYFLWSTMPDEELLKLAGQGSLQQPRTLRRQVERMLQHPKAKQFTTNFVGQWFDLREIDFTTPDRRLYPEFDDLLQVSMVQETERFFETLLRDDLSLLNFVDSDFTLLNERLARHYGIEGVRGQQFRKVRLPEDSHRGGVLTQASVLKVTANGTNTSPVLRGVWVLENLIGKPAPPPPANVPAVEPDTRGATTIREQLARHRELAACASCHKLIDPPGFALESFDVIGGWREYYRSAGSGEPVPLRVNGSGVRFKRGPDVDPSDVTADGETFHDIDDFKRILLEEPDQIARCVAEKLLTYATGGRIEFADRGEIERIVAEVRENDYRLRTLLHAIVQSETFRSK